MGNICLQILQIYAVFIVQLRQFGGVLTAGSHLGMATNIIGQNTVDCGRHGLTGITFEILSGGDVEIFGLSSTLKRWCEDIVDKILPGPTADIVHGHDGYHGEWRCWGGVGDVFGRREGWVVLGGSSGMRWATSQI